MSKSDMFQAPACPPLICLVEPKTGTQGCSYHMIIPDNTWRNNSWTHLDISTVSEAIVDFVISGFFFTLLNWKAHMLVKGRIRSHPQICKWLMHVTFHSTGLTFISMEVLIMDSNSTIPCLLTTSSQTVCSLPATCTPNTPVVKVHLWTDSFTTICDSQSHFFSLESYLMSQTSVTFILRRILNSILHAQYNTMKHSTHRHFHAHYVSDNITLKLFQRELHSLCVFSAWHQIWPLLFGDKDFTVK